MGRPTKLTPERHRRIVEAIRAGCYAEVAARAAGIVPSTYYDWLQRGQNGEASRSTVDELCAMSLTAVGPLAV
jgi:hypothetical protein